MHAYINNMVELCEVRGMFFREFKTNCQVFYLWSRVPQPYNRVNTTGCKEAVAGVGLQAVNDGFIPLQDPHQIRCLFLPDEEGAVV